MNFIKKVKLAFRFLKSAPITVSNARGFMDEFGTFIDLQSGEKNSGYVGSCANIYGLSFAKANFMVYDSQRENKPIPNHKAMQIFKRPNWLMTGWEMKYRMATDLIFEGNSYWMKLQNQIGVVSGLYPLLANRVNTYPYNTEAIEYFEYNSGLGVIKILPEQMVHIKNPDRSSIIKGLPLISRIADVVDVERMQLNYRSKIYKKAGWLGATFSTDVQMKKEEFDSRFELIKQKYGGEENMFNVAFFDSGIKPIATAYSPKDMQIKEDRELNRDEIISAFGVNKLMFGQSDNIQRGNADTVYFVFYDTIIDPYLNYIDECFTNQLMYIDYDSDYYVKHDKLAQRDIETDLKYYKNALGGDGNAAWMLPNEVREIEGLEPDDRLDEMALSKSQPPAV